MARLSDVRKNSFPSAAREILFQAIANGSVVSWQHINLLGEYDYSNEKLQDSADLSLPRRERRASQTNKYFRL
jgi:hypothetical protein